MVETEDAGIARIKVGLAPNSTSLRAGAGHADGTPTDDELKIYNYALFIFNSAGMLEASLIATPYSTSASNPEPADYGDIAPLTFDQAFNPNLDSDGVLTVSAGNKTFFAIVNAPYQLLEKQTQYLNDNSLNRQTLSSETLTLEDLSLIVGAYNDENTDLVWFENDIEETGNRGFMMTTIGTAGYHEQYLNASVDENDIIPVQLTVGRAMAKVSLTSELGTTPDETQPNGVLEVESYKIINNPKEMFIMPNIVNSVLTTPYYYETGVIETNYFASHNSTSLALETNYVPVSEVGAETFTYCIENANLTPRQGNATIAVVKGVFTPGGNASIYNSPLDRTSTGEGYLNTGDTFYRIWIPQYTRTDGELAGGRYDGNYYTQDPTGDLPQYIIDAKDEYAWNENEIKLVVDTFEDGVCYYRLPLENKNNSMSPYTVKRNSYYQITIKSVMDAGYPGEDGGDGNEVDPTDPLEPQTHITVDITVSDWDEIPQEGNL